MTADDAEFENKHHRGDDGKFRKKGSYYNTSVFVDNARRSAYNQKLRDVITSDGYQIKTCSGHAAGRAIQRGISADKIIECLTKAKPAVSKQDPTKLLYEYDNYRVVFSPKDNAIVTVIDKDKHRQRRRGKYGNKS